MGERSGQRQAERVKCSSTLPHAGLYSTCPQCHVTWLEGCPGPWVHGHLHRQTKTGFSPLLSFLICPWPLAPQANHGVGDEGACSQPGSTQRTAPLASPTWVQHLPLSTPQPRPSPAIREHSPLVPGELMQSSLGHKPHPPLGSGLRDASPACCMEQVQPPKASPSRAVGGHSPTSYFHGKTSCPQRLRSRTQRMSPMEAGKGQAPGREWSPSPGGSVDGRGPSSPWMDPSAVCRSGRRMGLGIGSSYGELPGKRGFPYKQTKPCVSRGQRTGRRSMVDWRSHRTG